MSELVIHLNTAKGNEFIDSIKKKRFSFALVISHTDTSEIPGITVAGANSEMMKFTPPADAEFLHYGSCLCIDEIPMTPNGKPTPALLTKVALESASIPHLVINAGSKIIPKLPYIATDLPSGKNISKEPALSDEDVAHAVDFGRIVGRTLASLTDCLVIGESLPGGTTTALATLKGLGYNAKVSSSSPENPSDLKNSITDQAISRLTNKAPFSIVANMGDPMIPFVAGMISTASCVSKVLLAGGTQMAAVLAFAKTLGYHNSSVAIGTTSYVIDDKSANFLEIIKQIDDIPVISIDPKLSESKIPGLRAFSEGFAKEGVGAGGSIISAILRAKLTTNQLLQNIESEYNRIFT